MSTQFLTLSEVVAKTIADTLTGVNAEAPFKTVGHTVEGSESLHSCGHIKRT